MKLSYKLFLQSLSIYCNNISQRKESMTNNNNSRYYYMSNENMSDIKQSIDEYSMNFQKQSGIHANSKSEIAQMISGSHQITQSRNANKSKTTIKQPPNVTIKQQKNYEAEPIREQVMQPDSHKKPLNLGQKVYKVIQQRYLQVMKISTDDPQVLHNFYLSQRKQISTMKPIKMQDIEKQMPSMQRKLIIKKQFQNILTYYPDDVFYTLHCQAEKSKKDRQLQQKLQYFNKINVSKDKNKKVIQQPQMKQIIQALYDPKGMIKNKQQQVQRQTDRFIHPDHKKQKSQKIKRSNFGRNLSQHFQNTYRQKPHPQNVQTVDKLYQFWDRIYENQKGQYGIQWPQDTAKQSIRLYMYEQIQSLLAYANKKLGFKCGKAQSLWKLYVENYQKMENIYIPMNSFEEYVKVYNEIQSQKQYAKQKSNMQNQMQRQIQKKKKQVKKFGRPVSATPLTILSKPKDHSTSVLQNLAQKYSNDKLIKTLLAEQHLKKARYAFQYGVYNMEDQVKLKQWVKINTKKHNKYQDIITDKLIKTFTNQQFSSVKHTDQVSSLLSEDNLEKKQVWNELGPILHQAMLVKAHQQPWFRDCLIRYLDKIQKHSHSQKQISQNKLQTNQIILKRIFAYLDNLNQSQKQRQFQLLDTLIQNSQNIAKKQQQIQAIKNDPTRNKFEKQRRLLNALLEDKAIQYLKMRIRKTNEKFTLRNYLKQLYQECLKQHKDYVKKTFNVVEGDKQCPKLLKYQFFRNVKLINPITFQKQSVAKNHVWVPPKQNPQGFNYKTYNTFSQFYMKDRNIIVAGPESQKYKETIWGRKKVSDRENLLMTFDDARQCVFVPKSLKKQK